MIMSRLLLTVSVFGALLSLSCDPARAQNLSQNLTPDLNQLLVTSTSTVASGPVGTYSLMYGDQRMIWYFDNVGLTPYVTLASQLQIRAYLNQYLTYANPSSGEISDFVDGTRTGTSDSDDSYCATFLSLAVLYRTKTGDSSWWKYNLAELKNLANKTLVDRLKSNNLIACKVAGSSDPTKNVAYLIDNCEDWAGLHAFATQLAADGDPDAPTYAKVAQDVTSGIASLYQSSRGAFDTADVPASSDFYPDRVAQVYPQLYGVPFGATTTTMYNKAWAYLNGTTEQWDTCQDPDRSKDGFPWMVLGYVAAERGDTADVNLALTQFKVYLNNMNENPQTIRFTAVQEVGFATALQKVLGY